MFFGNYSFLFIMKRRGGKSGDILKIYETKKTLGARIVDFIAELLGFLIGKLRENDL